MNNAHPTPNFSFQFHWIHLSFSIVINAAGHFPDHDVVVSGRACKGKLGLRVGVPGDVSESGGVATVNEEELRRTVFRVVWSLLGPNGAEIPDVDASVRGGGREVCRGVGRPLDLQNIIGVRFERV